MCKRVNTCDHTHITAHDGAPTQTDLEGETATLEGGPFEVSAASSRSIGPPLTWRAALRASERGGGVLCVSEMRERERERVLKNMGRVWRECLLECVQRVCEM